MEVRGPRSSDRAEGYRRECTEWGGVCPVSCPRSLIPELWRSWWSLVGSGSGGLGQPKRSAWNWGIFGAQEGGNSATPLLSVLLSLGLVTHSNCGLKICGKFQKSRIPSS